MTGTAERYAEAVAHFTAGRNDQAEEACRKIVAQDDHQADAHNLLGLTLRRRGDHASALISFDRAAEINPSLAPIHLNRGLTLTQLGRMGEAEAAFRQALQSDPASSPAHFHLGVILHHRAQYDEATEHLAAVAEAEPNHANTRAMMGVGLLMLGRLSEAKVSLIKATELNPALSTPHDGLGVIAEVEGRFEEAIGHFDSALTLDPNFATAHFNRAVARLRRGDLAQGLPEFEWRWRLPRDASAAAMRDFPQPLWTGEHLGDKALLVWGEQGLGDEIRAAGVVDDMARRGDKIVLECDERLLPLLQRSMPDVQCVARQTPAATETTAAKVGWQCPGDTLLRHVRPTLDRFSQRTSYVVADGARRTTFQTRLKEIAKNRPIIGVSWSSQNAKFMHGKSLPLAAWAPLLASKDCCFVDLQYGETAAERATCQRGHGVCLTHLPDLDAMTDIDGLAALISACDLVITVSNTTAHLAGALGTPTWVMVPFGHFQPWYWFSTRTDSPWYPSVRLYRQSKVDDWPAVLDRMTKDFSNWPPSAAISP